MKTRKRELAKVGIFGSIDNPIIVTEKDLEEIAKTFAEQKTAPIQFGHWADSASPRLGNVVAVSYDKKTKTLTGEVEEEDVLFDAVEKGYFPDCSIGAKKRASDGMMYLHHLAYLGEEPPAIKDLKKEIKETLKVASDKDFNVILLPEASAKELNLSDLVSAKSCPSTENPEMKNKEMSMTEQEIKAMQEENARLKAENEANEKLLSDYNKTSLAAEKAKLKEAVTGKISQADTVSLLNLCDAFESGKTIELSDADGGTKKESPVAVLTEIFSRVKLPVEPGEFTLSDAVATKKLQHKYTLMMKSL